MNTNSTPTPENGGNPLGVMPIPQLLMKYAIPSVVSMLVTALYNIVDQIFIGRGVGYLGNTATTIAFPLIVIGLALALLIGNGGAAFISLELGRGNAQNTRRTLGNALTLLLISSIVFSAGVLLFLRPVLTLFGATEMIMPYAVDYVSVIMLGMPFNMIAVSIANMIRADGSPRFSMFSMLVGAVLNCILDPIFIFGFDMGVKGAAVATLISQVVSFLLVLFYIVRRAKYVRFALEYMRLDRFVTGKMLALGSSSFITQMAISILNVVLNNALRHYGALSAYGSEAPLAAMGIVMKINAILISVILGIVIGAQPILGFNYGAGNYARVKKTFFTSITITFALSVVANILFVATPATFIGIFGDNSPEFIDFGCKALRTYLAFVACAGLQIPSANYFQAVGKPLKAMTLTMTRQILFIVPLILILPVFFGIDGILYAGPLGDISATLVSVIFIFREMRRLDTALPGNAASLS